MKTRIISCAVIVVFVVAIVLFNSIFPLALNISIALISAMAVYEIIAALGLSKNYILTMPSLVFAAAFPFVTDPTLQGIAYFVYTVVMFANIILYHKFVTFRELGVIYSMALLIPSALDMLIRLRASGGPHGMFYVIIAIFSAWGADVGAFLAGTFLGKHKLCPEISPKKTVEGLIGGVIFNVGLLALFGFLFELYYQNTIHVSYLALMIIGLVGSVMSVLGDLSFSLIKRSCHIKDFGEIIPGHGGILDRFDSVIFCGPFVYFFVQYLPLVLA